jgi:hypothetical protein
MRGGAARGPGPAAFGLAVLLGLDQGCPTGVILPVRLARFGGVCDVTAAEGVK